MELFFQWTAGILGVAAGLTWLAACFVNVKFRSVIDKDGWQSGGVYEERSDGKLVDVIASVKLGNQVNAAAAAFTSLAAFAQVAALVTHKSG